MVLLKHVCLLIFSFFSFWIQSVMLLAIEIVDL